MSDPLTLVQANMAICSVAAAGWWVVGRALGIAPIIAMRFALANAVLALSLFLTMQRGGDAAVWLHYWLADVLGLLGYAILGAGAKRLARRRINYRRYGAILLLAALLLGLNGYAPGDGYHTVVYSATAAWLLAGITRDVLRSRDHWHDPRSAWMVVSPLLVIMLLFLLRALYVLQAGGEPPEGILSADPFNVLFLFVALVLTLAGNIVLVSVVILRLIDRLNHLSMTDAMTGTLNRRAFNKHLGSMHEQAVSGRLYSLCVLDLDYFKRVNDQLGHAAGDAAILHLVQILRAGLREADLLGRFGGEEFCILLPDTGHEEALGVTSRLRADLEKHVFEWEGRVWPLTASFGVTTFSPQDQVPEVLLRRADQAMYRAKARGRNCVEQS